MKSGDIRIFFILILLSVSGGIYSQGILSDTGYYDTTEYIPAFYKGSLDYNLMIAASKGYTYEINRLVMQGADIFAASDEGVTPLIFAVSGNHTQVAKLLIDYGSDVNKVTGQLMTPLIIAVKNQNPEIAEALIRAGADINATDRYDATALHYASAYGFLQIADMLLYYDADPEKKTEEGSTPLLASVWAGNADIADLLLQNGANIESRDNEGYTPFLMAAMNGDTLIMDLLFRKGADIYATNNLKYNALTLTIIGDQMDAVHYLLKIGNKWSTQGNSAASPYSVASRYRRKDMINILQKNNIPGKIEHSIDQADIMISSRFFLHDYYSGISVSFKEPFINGGIIVGCDTKIWYTKVLVQQSEHTFYQYMSKGSVFYAGLFKDFAITDFAYKGNFGFSASLSAGYSFGNQFKGTLNSTRSKFMAIPAVALKWTTKELSLSLGADYMRTDFYKVGPIWIRAGISYSLSFERIRPRSKTLKWY
jgi:uncharacterized protein